MFAPILLYLAAVVAANLLAAAFGAPATIPIAVGLIGLTITVRDHLHDLARAHGLPLPLLMGLLIAAGGALSFIINAAALPIAMASMIAFIASETADAIVYHLNRNRPWLIRSNKSNLVSAPIDSVVFVTLAFGFSPLIIVLQIAAKLLGGLLWSLAIQRLNDRAARPQPVRLTG